MNGWTLVTNYQYLSSAYDHGHFTELNPGPAKPGYIYPAFANSLDLDQLASEEGN